MPVTMKDVRAALDPDEVDYAAAARLGPEALPHLAVLVREAEPGLAAKAAYLAGALQFQGEQAEEIVAMAASNGDARVRVAAASAAALLAPESASRVLNGLVVDSDAGVQKLALRSVPSSPSAELRSTVQNVSKNAPDRGLREIAESVLKGLR